MRNLLKTCPLLCVRGCHCQGNLSSILPARFSSQTQHERRLSEPRTCAGNSNNENQRVICQLLSQDLRVPRTRPNDSLWVRHQDGPLVTVVFLTFLSPEAMSTTGPSGHDSKSLLISRGPQGQRAQARAELRARCPWTVLVRICHPGAGPLQSVPACTLTSQSLTPVPNSVCKAHELTGNPGQARREVFNPSQRPICSASTGLLPRRLLPCLPVSEAVTVASKMYSGP